MIGRFAPSPSGRMHLGNLWSCLLAWLAARSAGGSIVLRLEDLDPDRCRQEYCDQVMRDLEWLGLDWDGQPVYQSRRTEAYAAAFRAGGLGRRPIVRAAGPRSTRRRLKRWPAGGWSIPATVHVQSVWLPLPPTARTE